MKRDDVPQDDSSTMAGQRKALYAVDRQGHYTTVASSGWEPEQVVLDQAVAEFRRRACQAWHAARAGSAAPLAFHMFDARMDVTVLAQASGLFRWQVRRDLAARRFARLSAKRLRRYADALGLTCEQLQRLPTEPPA